MKKTMPRKPTKKSPAKRMKPLPIIGLQVRRLTGEVISAHVQNCNDEKFVDCCDELGWIACCPIPLTELPAPTDSHAGDEGRKLEEIREALRKSHSPQEFTSLSARVLGRTPTAKGGRG